MEISEIPTVKEAAQFFRNTRQQIRNGEILAVKVGLEWRIPLVAIQQFIADNC